MVMLTRPTPKVTNSQVAAHRYKYKKCYALFPVKCENNEKVWLEYYYKKYDIIRPWEPYHLYNVSEQYAIIDRLIEGI